MTDSMQILILITVAANLGLVIAGLIMMGLHQSRTIQMINRIRTLEDRILARILMEEQGDQMIMEAMNEGTPVTLEDLIRQDLIEQMGTDPDLMTPATDEEIQMMLQETLEARPETETLKTPIDTDVETPLVKTSKYPK